MSLPSTLNQEPFTWRGLPFRWSSVRSAWITGLSLSRPPALSHWVMVQDHGGSQNTPTQVLGTFKAWVEFDGGGYTDACTMNDRESAIEGALVALDEHYATMRLRLRELLEP